MSYDKQIKIFANTTLFTPTDHNETLFHLFLMIEFWQTFVKHSIDDFFSLTYLQINLKNQSNLTVIVTLKLLTKSYG